MKETRALEKAGLLKKPPPKKQKKIKKILKEAEARAQGELLGQYKAHSKKPWDTSLKEHLGHWIDNINPLDLAAMGAGTVIIHSLIINSPALMQQAKSYAPSAILTGLLGVTVQAIEEYYRGPVVKLPDPLTDDWKYWVASYFCAFILVRHGGNIFGLLEGGLAKIVGLMLA